MINNLPKPKISSNFTIDDIHLIREWNFERLADSTKEERITDIKKSADEFLELINLRKNLSQ